VKALKVGDRVVCHPIVGRHPNGAPKLLSVDTSGTCAEQIGPDALDFITAAVVGRHGPLTFTQLRDRAQVRPNEWALVMAAAGGLGSALVQRKGVLWQGLKPASPLLSPNGHSATEAAR